MKIYQKKNNERKPKGKRARVVSRTWSNFVCPKSKQRHVGNNSKAWVQQQVVPPKILCAGPSLPKVAPDKMKKKKILIKKGREAGLTLRFYCSLYFCYCTYFRSPNDNITLGNPINAIVFHAQMEVSYQNLSPLTLL